MGHGGVAANAIEVEPACRHSCHRLKYENKVIGVPVSCHVALAESDFSLTAQPREKSLGRVTVITGANSGPMNEPSETARVRPACRSDSTLGTSSDGCPQGRSSWWPQVRPASEIDCSRLRNDVRLRCHSHLGCTAIPLRQSLIPLVGSTIGCGVLTCASMTAE